MPPKEQAFVAFWLPATVPQQVCRYAARGRWETCSSTFLWNWMLTRWGCAPSDCQYVSSRPSLSSSTPLPCLALVTVHTARSPISRRKRWSGSSACTTTALRT